MNLLNEKYICQFCMAEMTAEQIFCCDTYKGKMTLSEFQEYYGEEV